MVDGAPLNVAAGLTRLGTSAQFVTSIGTDALGQRIWDLLADLGVGTRACVRVDVPTTLALTSLRDAVPALVGFAVVAASLARTVPGGATAMPALDEIRTHRL